MASVVVLRGVEVAGHIGPEDFTSGKAITRVVEEGIYLSRFDLFRVGSLSSRSLVVSKRRYRGRIEAV